MEKDNYYLLETAVGLVFGKNDEIIDYYKFETIDEASDFYLQNNQTLSLKNFLSKTVKGHIIKMVSKTNYITTDVIIAPELKEKHTVSNICTIFNISEDEFNAFLYQLALKINGIPKPVDIISLYRLVDSLEVDINSRIMRLKEWYSLHFPELECNDNIEYLNMILKIRNRLNFIKNTDINDQELIVLAKNSMGCEFGPDEISNIVADVENVIEDIKNKDDFFDILKNAIQSEFPNLYELMGNTKQDIMVLCKLFICTNNRLYTYPGSAIQVLGAKKEKSKFGIIFNSSYISKTKTNKGKISRMLANKIALCAKIDSGNTKNNEYGIKFKQSILSKIESINDGQSCDGISMDVFNEKIYKKKDVEFIKKN